MANFMSFPLFLSLPLVDQLSELIRFEHSPMQRCKQSYFVDHEYQFIRIRLSENHSRACEREMRECAQGGTCQKYESNFCFFSFCFQDQMMKSLLLLQKLQDEKEDWDMGMQNTKMRTEGVF